MDPESAISTAIHIGGGPPGPTDGARVDQSTVSLRFGAAALPVESADTETRFGVG
jgi:hypothetical protein